MTKTEAQQQLAELVDARTQRAAAAEIAKRASAAAQARLSQLRATMRQDGAVMTERIAAAEKELAAAAAQELDAASVVMALWANVATDMERYIAAAQEAVKQARIDEMSAELSKLMASEKARRLAFATALHDFAEVGYDLRQMLTRKWALKMALHEMGVIVDAGSDQLDAYPNYGIGELSTVTAAQEMMTRYG